MLSNFSEKTYAVWLFLRGPILNVEVWALHLSYYCLPFVTAAAAPADTAPTAAVQLNHLRHHFLTALADALCHFLKIH